MWRQSQINKYRPSFVLEASVRKVQANSEHVVSIFIDKEKAYDLTWRHGILIDLHEAGKEERMFRFIENFLRARSFKVKVNETLSNTKAQTESIPQGSVVSPTFFILTINKIVAKLPDYNRLQIPLYMDDLQISYRHRNSKVVERKL